jgi:hypothetical protein
MKNYMVSIAFVCFLGVELRAQEDTLGRGLYTRHRTYENGVAQVFNSYVKTLRDTLVIGGVDTVWMCCDTTIRGRSYLRFGDTLQGWGAYTIEQDGDFWIFDPKANQEYLFIPNTAPIGYHIYMSSLKEDVTIVNNKATLKLYNVFFEDLIELKLIINGYSMTAYYKKGVGNIALMKDGVLVAALERNLFESRMRP